MKRVVWVVVLGIVALSLSGCCCCAPGGQTSSEVARGIAAGPVQRETRQIEAGDADRVQVRIVFGGGELDIQGGGDLLLDARFVYNVDVLEPEILYDVQDKQGRLEIRHKADIPPRDILTTELRNEWDLKFGDSVPLSMDLDVGTSSGRVKLGGLPLSSLNIGAGAADMRVDFDDPNPERLTTLNVLSGAAKLELYKLGNANLDELTFDGGLGSYTFDFRGKWQHSANVHIQAGASQVDLRVPQDIGVRVCPGDLGRGRYGGLQAKDGCYVNRLYGESDIILDISLDLGLGKLNVRQVN